MGLWPAHHHCIRPQRQCLDDVGTGPDAGVEQHRQTVGRRDDGNHIFYPEQVNLVFGDPETGKTWLCLWCAACALINDPTSRVAVIDMDHNGPTAVLLSNYHSKNYGMINRASRLLNIKLSPKCVAGDDGTEKIVNLIRTWCDLKLWHLQFNIVNKQTLVNAQKDPDNYRSLLVRIAGYSAYFCDLSRDLQNDIIDRTEHAQF